MKTLEEIVSNINENYGTEVEVETEPENDFEEIIPYDFSKTIFDVLTFAVQVHIYHLQTKSGNDHLAMGDFYDLLKEKGDEIAERYIGMGNDIGYYETFEFECETEYDKDSFLEELEEFKADIVDGIEYTSDADMMSIQESLVDISGAIDTLKYKLQMI